MSDEDKWIQEPDRNEEGNIECGWTEDGIQVINNLTGQEDILGYPRMNPVNTGSTICVE